MILRRVIQHVKAQDWTAIVIDLAIVVIGVFIGIQVSNWNEVRQDRARAREYEARIRDDLRDELGSIDSRVRFYTDLRTRLEHVIAGLNGPSDTIDEQFLIDAYLASNISNVRQFDDTYRELNSSGELGLIADQRTRAALARHYADVVARMQTLNGVTGYREQLRTQMPFDIQRRIRTACLKVVEGKLAMVDLVAVQGCDPGLDAADIRRGAAALAPSGRVGTGLANTANRLVSDFDQRVENLATVRRDIVSLLRTMER